MSWKTLQYGEGMKAVVKSSFDCEYRDGPFECRHMASLQQDDETYRDCNRWFMGAIGSKVPLPFICARRYCPIRKPWWRFWS